jgi:hypothetical protein
MADTSHSIKWKSFYQAAILETDWSKLQGHIDAADLAIKTRLFEFSQDHGGTPEENQAIRDALSGLIIPREEVKEWHQALWLGPGKWRSDSSAYAEVSDEDK